MEPQNLSSSKKRRQTMRLLLGLAQASAAVGKSVDSIESLVRGALDGLGVVLRPDEREAVLLEPHLASVYLAVVAGGIEGVTRARLTKQLGPGVRVEEALSVLLKRNSIERYQRRLRCRRIAEEASVSVAAPKMLQPGVPFRRGPASEMKSKSRLFYPSPVIRVVIPTRRKQA